MAFRSTKTYGHHLGLSACFRQHRAKSHCRLLHGYPLSFKLVFEADTLDANHWVVDFGALKPVRDYLVATFDHKMLVAEDDPMMDTLAGLAGLGLADVVVVPATGCEAFAKMVGEHVQTWLCGVQGDRVRLVSVECREHEANSGMWAPCAYT